MISFQNKARPPNEISEQTAKKLLEYLISKGKMAEFFSTQKAPYARFIQTKLLE